LLGEVENVHIMAYNLSYSVIFLAKVVKLIEI